MAVVAPSWSNRSRASGRVWMGPPATEFTRTPRGLYSAVQLWVIESSAALVAPYAAPDGRPMRPAMLVMLMMLPAPLVAIAGANAPTSRYGARTLLANISSKSATLMSFVGAQTDRPALLTR